VAVQLLLVLAKQPGKRPRSLPNTHRQGIIRDLDLLAQVLAGENTDKSGRERRYWSAPESILAVSARINSDQHSVANQPLQQPKAELKRGRQHEHPAPQTPTTRSSLSFLDLKVLTDGNLPSNVAGRRE